MAYRHGFCGRKNSHPVYWVWAGMMQRCNYPKHISWQWYGGKGIRVCDRWHDFALFWEDMGPTWAEGLTIDRKDSEGDYCKENCRWATTHEQRMNDTHGALYEFRGQAKRLPAWADEFGLAVPTIRARLKRGWDLEKSLLTTLNATRSEACKLREKIKRERKPTQINP